MTPVTLNNYSALSSFTPGDGGYACRTFFNPRKENLMILNPYAIVIDVYATLGGKQPGATSYADHKAYINANGQAAYLTALEGMFATQTNATMSATILANLGLASIFTAAQGEAYLAANAGNRVKAALDLASALTNYVSDATNTNDTAILAAKTTYVATTANAYTYASNSANTSDAATSAAAVSTGQTFALTTGIDSLTGTAGADTFTATYDGAATGLLGAADTVNGGEGADVLNVTASDDAIANLPGATVSNIETINVRNIDGNATAEVLTVNGANFSGHTSLNTDRSTDSVTFTNVAAAASVGVIGNGSVTNGATVATYVAAATAPVLNISGGTTAGAIALTAAGGTTLTINSTGAANTVGAVSTASTGILTTTINADTTLATGGLTIGTNAAAQALVVSGAAANIAATSTAAETSAVVLGALDADFASINASGLTAGGITATLSSTVAATLVGGAGNDIITTSTSGQTGSVNAGDGTDILVVDATVDLDTTTEGAKYTNFETLSVSNNQVVSNISGITKVLVTDGSNAISGLNAAQAAAITQTATGNTNSYALTNATGSSDVLTLNLSSDTAATNVDAGAITANGFETININATTGTAGTQSDFAFAANGADNATKINVTGSAETTFAAAAVLDVAAVAVDASDATGAFTFTGTMLTGSTVTGSSTAINTLTLSTTLGTTYTGGAANDVFNVATVADLVATGANDNKIIGGANTTAAGDNVVLAATTNTLTDNHFTYVSGVETLTTSTSTTSITTGGAFNAAFASGANITSGTLADTTVYTLAAGLSNSNLTVLIDGTSLQGTGAGEDVNITTGSGDDTVTITGTAFVGATGGDAGAYIVSTGAGADTISVSTGTLLSDTTGLSVVITGGTGADTITKVGTNDESVTTDGFGKASFVIADGDSLVAGRDKITGFDIGDGASISDSLDFVNVGTVLNGGAADGTDSGTILSHSTATGIITFDDNNTFGTALNINAANLDDVITYLTTNLTAAGTTVAFGYDSNGSGTADSTMVFNAGVGANDSLVELVGVVGTSLSATNAITAGLIDVS